MSLDLCAKNTRLTSTPVKYIKSLPVMTGIQCINFAGVALAQNQMKDGSALTIVGTPEKVTDYSSKLVVFNSVDTTLNDFETATFMCVARVWASSTGKNSTLAGIYPNTANTARGFGIGMIDDGRLFASASVYDGTDSGTSSNVLAMTPTETGLPTTWDTGVWRCIAGKTWTDGGYVYAKIMDLTSGTSAQAASDSGLVRDMRNGSVVIAIGQGRGQNQDQTSPKEMAATFIHNAALSDDDISLNYAYLKSYFAYRGVTI